MEANDQDWLKTVWGHGRRFMELRPSRMVGEMIEFWGDLTTFDQPEPEITEDDNSEELTVSSPFINQGDNAAKQRTIDRNNLFGANLFGFNTAVTPPEILVVVIVIALSAGIWLYSRRPKTAEPKAHRSK